MTFTFNAILKLKNLIITALLFLILSVNIYAQITNINISIADQQAGATTSYTITFTTSSTLPADGRIVFSFPSGFDVSSAKVVSSDIDGTFTESNTGTDLIIQRNGDGTNTAAGQLSIQLDPITNATSALVYNLNMDTRTVTNTIIETGTGSFEILFEDQVASFTIVCNTTQTAGTAFSIQVQDAVDRYGNHWSGNGWVYIASGGGDSPDGYSPVLNTITVHNGDGQADQTLYNAQPTVIELSVGHLEQQTGTITVLPGTIGRFIISNEPGSVTAGSTFPSSVTVTAYDQYGNVKTDYSGNVVWSSTDSDPYPAQVPVDDGTGWSSGVKNFAGSGFILYNGPSQTLTVTDQSVSSATGTSSAITVTSHPDIASYDLSVPTGINQTAGVAFPLQVSNILDQYGNSWTGSKSITVAVFSGGGDSPDSHSPSLNNINVTTNSGSSDQTLVNSVPTVLSTSVDGVERVTSPIVVGPGLIDDFVISASSPQTAGATFSLSVSSAVDTMGNPWTGEVEVSIISPSSYNAPDGTPPAINNVFVTNGTGSANQTLTLTATTVMQGTAQSLSRTTGNIVVNPGPLYELNFTGIPASVTAGVAFTNDITVTAYDGYRNVKTDFSGPVTWTSSDPYQQTVPNDDGTGWSAGVKNFSGVDFALYTGPSQKLTVQSGSVSLSSNDISVLPGNINSFELSCGRNQVAGTPFSLIVTDAHDLYGNAWGGTVTVSAQTGGGDSPSGASPVFHNIVVENGTGESYQTLVNAETGVIIQGAASGVTDTVSNITVSPNMQPSALSRIIIRSGANGTGTQVFAEDIQVGQGLNLYAAGYDPYGNYRQDELVDWSSSGFNPSFSATNVSSVVFSSDAVGQGYVVATDSYTGISARTGTITVHPGPVASFNLDVISTQVAEEPFQITVTAVDSRGNTATDFTGTVQISDETGSISPAESGNFDSGVWNGYVTISSAATTGTSITVTETGATDPAPTGTSNVFNVLESDSPRIRILKTENLRSDISTQAATVTAGQDADWIIKLIVENSGIIDASLDSVRISFSIDNTVQSDYIISTPDTFFARGTNLIPAGAKDSLIVTIDHTGLATGTAVIQSYIYLRNATTGKPITDQGLATIDIVSPADVIISSVVPSQTQVTQGQVADWRVVVELENRGGSSVQLDSESVSISFSAGENWDVDMPPVYSGSHWIIEGNKKETITFTIDSTGINAEGLCSINISVPGTEINTNRALDINTSMSTPGTVELERAGNLFILSMGPSIRVNTGQTFILPVTIQNTGGDGIHDVVVQLRSNAMAPAFPSSFPATTEVAHLKGGEIKTVGIEILAAYTSNMGEEFIATLAGYTDNDTTYIVSDDASTKVVIDQPGVINIAGVTPSVSEVQGGQVDPWTIDVVVQNKGGAPVEIEKPSAQDVSFMINNITQNDYSIKAPEGFENTSDRLLLGGQSRILTYIVNGTGRLGGDLTISVNIKGKDQNDNSALSGSGNTIIKVVSEKDFRIISTSVNTPNVTEAGNGSVNINQDFYVDVVVENGLGRSVKNVEVSLTSNGSSITSAMSRIVAGLGPAEYTKISFLVTASDEENIQGEVFTAKITDATFENSTVKPPVGASLDSTAKVIIEKPASLNFTITLFDTTGKKLKDVVSTNQMFRVVVSVLNNGSAEIDKSGKMQISLPSGYELVSVEAKQTVEIDKDIVWLVKAPSTNTPDAQIYIRMSDFPREINTGNYANVEEQIHNVTVKTIQSWIKTSLSVNNPPGAKDNIISSGQLFWLKADLSWNNCKNLVAELSLPSGYTTQDDLQKSVLSNYVVWPVKAPENPSGPDVFRISAQGVDRLQDVIVNGDVDFLYVTTVNKADLSLSFEIVSPPDAIDGSVSIGQEFVIEASISNSGDAEILGSAEVALKTDDSGNLPGGYTTRDAIVQEMINGRASWTITAPDHMTGEAVTIEAQLVKLPFDENTNEDCYVSQGHNSVAVTTAGASLSVTTAAMPDDQGNILVPGEKNVILMVLQCENMGIEGANPIRVSMLKFVIENQSGSLINADKIFKSIQVVDKDRPDLIFGKITNFSTDDTVRIYLNQIDREPSVRVEEPRYLAICGQILETTDIEFFQLNLPDNRAVMAEDIDSGINVPVQSPFEENWVDLKSPLKRIFYPDKEVTLCNSPNPFGEPGRESTVFVYYLKEPTDVTFIIFTLTGQLVWKKSFNAVSVQGSAGMHDTPANSVVWDALNDRGNKVLNGVYILVMKTGSGKIEKTKIAVVK